MEAGWITWFVLSGLLMIVVTFFVVQVCYSYCIPEETKYEQERAKAALKAWQAEQDKINGSRKRQTFVANVMRGKDRREKKVVIKDKGKIGQMDQKKKDDEEKRLIEEANQNKQQNIFSMSGVKTKTPEKRVQFENDDTDK